MAPSPLDIDPFEPGQPYDPAVAQAAIASAEQSLAALSQDEPAEFGWRIRTADPAAHYAHAMAYDSARGVIVLFGGKDDSSYLADTWEWDGVNWVQRFPANKPSARELHAMVYDSARRVTVLFGGANANYLGDTWEWDGVNWVQRSSATTPSARYGHAMAYDSTRGVTVLFGGEEAAGDLNDTWEWDGVNWVQRSPATKPSTRKGHAMIYDSVRGLTVLFGGHSGAFRKNDTWEWDGTNWVQRSPTTKPGERDWHAMAYDNARKVTVLSGGYGSGSLGPYKNDTWEWDGTNWTERSPATKLFIPTMHAMAYDSAHGVTVLFGGYYFLYDDHYLSDTWEWDGINWAEPSSKPSGRSELAAAYDSARRMTVLFGGGGYRDDTWEWNGGNWVQRSSATKPSVRRGHAMAYDSARGVTVLFGGYYCTSGCTHLDDTWEWDGVNWVQRFPATKPSARYGHAMVYDSARRVTVLFGGYGLSYLSDTWEWDGANWVQRASATKPSARDDHAMAYDSTRKVTVLFGGRCSGSPYYLNDTWEWNGVTWVQRTPATYPPARQGHAMAYDSARGVTVLFGGGQGLSKWADTGEWDGTNWVQRTPVTYPPARDGHAMTYDSARGVTVLFGGRQHWGDLADAWEYGPPLPPPVLFPIANSDGDGDYLVMWDAVPGATIYTLQEDSSASFAAPVVRYTGGDTQFAFTGKPAGSSWYYRVKASDADGESSWSNVESVSVVPDAPGLSPINNPDGDGSYLIDWNEVTGATSYALEEDDNSAFTSPIGRYAGANSQYQVWRQQVGIWYYRVRASNAGGNGGWSNSQVVSVVIPPPPPVYLPLVLRNH